METGGIVQITVNDRGWGLFHDNWLNYRLAHGHFNHVPFSCSVSYIHPVPSSSISVSQDLLATGAPQMVAVEVICSVHQHNQLCCIDHHQPAGHKDHHMLCEGEGGSMCVMQASACSVSARMIVLVMLPWLPRHTWLYCMNTQLCISPGYSGMCSRHTDTDLIAEFQLGEGQTLPTSTCEGTIGRSL